MKKTASLFLALMLLFGAVCVSSAEETKSFDPAAVTAGMLDNVNQVLENNVTVAESDTPGLYKVYYRAMDMGCYLTVTGSEETPEVMNKIGVSEIFFYEENTAQTYLTFFLAVSAAVEQYVTGEEFVEVLKTLTGMIQTAMEKQGQAESFTVGAYTATLSVEGGSGMILLDFEIRA